jgi:hypothetical protein
VVISISPPRAGLGWSRRRGRMPLAGDRGGPNGTLSETCPTTSVEGPARCVPTQRRDCQVPGAAPPRRVVHRRLKFLLVRAMILSQLSVILANAQAQCESSLDCVNPVPANDISTEEFINAWVDTYSYTWRTISSNGTVSGSVVVPNPAGQSCPSVTFSVSGTISASAQRDGTQGFTDFTWKATSPSPSGECGGWTPIPFTYSGTIQNNGNDLAPNTAWTDADGQGSTTVSKIPSDIPVSEQTIAVGFSSGLHATLGQFRQILAAASGSTDIFRGRQILEYTGYGTSYDTCWFQGSTYQRWNSVTGSAWNVGYYALDPPYIASLNEWADDYVGWNANAVTYYQSYYDGSGKSPFCGARVPQLMYIRTGGTSGQAQYYSSDTIGEDIYLTQVRAYRAGMSQATAFPQ